MIGNKSGCVIGKGADCLFDVCKLYSIYGISHHLCVLERLSVSTTARYLLRCRCIYTYLPTNLPNIPATFSPTPLRCAGAPSDVRCRHEHPSTAVTAPHRTAPVCTFSFRAQPPMRIHSSSEYFFPAFGWSFSFSFSFRS